MGSISSGLKRFFEEVFFQGRWTEQVWKDKLAGGFTDSGSRSGDKVNTIFDIVTFASQMGGTCASWSRCSARPAADRFP